MRRGPRPQYLEALRDRRAVARRVDDRSVLYGKRPVGGVHDVELKAADTQVELLVERRMRVLHVRWRLDGSVLFDVVAVVRRQDLHLVGAQRAVQTVRTRRTRAGGNRRDNPNRGQSRECGSLRIHHQR
jgi:chloramphenicol 3-O-phosphotransferase